MLIQAQQSLSLSKHWKKSKNQFLMNKFIVTIFYQLQVYNGWSCKYPYNEIVDNQYVVESSKSIDDLERLLLYNKRDSYIQIHITQATDPVSHSITEDEMVKILKGARISICTGGSDDNRPDSFVHRNRGWNAFQESEELYRKSVLLGQISSCFHFGNVEVVILKGLIYGVMSHGKCVVPFGNYSWIEPFNYGVARVVRNQKWGIIDTSGKEVLPLEYDNIRSVESMNNNAIIECYKDGKKQIINIISL